MDKCCLKLNILSLWRSLLFFPILHEEVCRSWKHPHLARVSRHKPQCTRVYRGDAFGSHLAKKAIQDDIRAGNQGLCSGWADGAYLHATSLLQLFWADTLCDLVTVIDRFQKTTTQAALKSYSSAVAGWEQSRKSPSDLKRQKESVASQAPPQKVWLSGGHSRLRRSRHDSKPTQHKEPVPLRCPPEIMLPALTAEACQAAVIVNEPEAKRLLLLLDH